MRVDQKIKKTKSPKTCLFLNQNIFDFFLASLQKKYKKGQIETPLR